MYLTCCKILGVKPGASLETIKLAYRKSAKELHPDRNDSEKAHEYFTLLNNAYQYLLSHDFSEEEVKQLVRNRIKRQRMAGRPPPGFKRYSKAEGYSLQELLKRSFMARVFYLGFHILFIIIGLWLVFHAIFDLFFHKIHDSANPFSAYVSLIFGFFFGIVLVSVFLITGISFFRNR